MFIRRPRLLTLHPSAAWCRADCLPQISDVSSCLPRQISAECPVLLWGIPAGLIPRERVEVFFWIWESQRNNQGLFVLWIYVPSCFPLLWGVYCWECPQQSLVSVPAAPGCHARPLPLVLDQQYWEQEMIPFDESHKIKPGIRFWCWLLLFMLSLFFCDGPFIHLEMPQEKWMIFWQPQKNEEQSAREVAGWFVALNASHWLFLLEN